MQESKLKQFMSDPEMERAVHDRLLFHFLKTKDADTTEMKAAQRIAIDLLFESWTSLQRYKPSQMQEGPTQRQPGL